MTTMRRGPTCRSLLVFLGAAVACVMSIRADARAFVHTANANNITSNSTWIDEPSANSDPNAILIVTPAGGDANAHPISVWYEVGRGRWAVFNQDMAVMVEGAAFQVSVASGPSAFVHRASAKNTVGNATYVDNPASNK